MSTWNEIRALVEVDLLEEEFRRRPMAMLQDIENLGYSILGYSIILFWFFYMEDVECASEGHDFMEQGNSYEGKTVYCKKCGWIVRDD